MKKLLFISGVIILVGIIVYIFFINKTALSPGIGGSSQPSGEEISVATNTLTEIKDINKNLPTGQTFYVSVRDGSVKVNNFYLKNPPILEADTIGIFSSKLYAIMYSMNESIFWINFNNSPESNLQIEAENNFISLLGITKSDACRLTAWETVGSFAKKMPLSFCGTFVK